MIKSGAKGAGQDKKKTKNGEQNSSRWPFNRKGKQKGKPLEMMDEPVDYSDLGEREVCQGTHQLGLGLHKSKEEEVSRDCEVEASSPLIMDVSSYDRPVVPENGDVEKLRLSPTTAPSPPSYPPEVLMERTSPNANGNSFSPSKSPLSALSRREEALVRELEELRAKAAQMERTMRWWSDCTANWREKWGKVRAERNRLREEVKILYGRNDVLTQELANAKRDLEDYVIENESLKHDLEKVQSDMKRLDREKRTAIVGPHKQVKLDHSQSVYESTVPKLGAELQFLEQILGENKAIITECDIKKESAMRKDTQSESFGDQEKILGDKTRENIALKSELEELKKAVECRQGDTRQSEDIRERRHTDTLDSAGSGGSSKSAKDAKLKELRNVIEKLQSENALEWEKREHVESEKLSLERETKRLRSVIEELEEEVRKKTDQVANAQTAGMKFLQTELEQKTQELLELRLAHKKVLKQLQEKTEELEHEKKRTEQYESEIKKLRARVEELKKKLNEAEEKADNQSNSVRRLQRQLEEQCQQTQNLHSEIDHLTNRMKRQSITSRSNITEESNSDEESPELL